MVVVEGRWRYCKQENNIFCFCREKTRWRRNLLLDIQPLLLQPLPGCRWIYTVGDTFAFTSKDLGRFTSLAWGTQGTDPKTGKLKARYPIFLGNGEVFFLNQNMLRVQQHVGWKYDAFQRIKLQTASGGESQSVTRRIPTQQPPRYGQILGIQPRFPKINKTTDQPQGSSTKNLSSLSSVVRGSHD